jgi:hypothetical protein
MNHVGGKAYRLDAKTLAERQSAMKARMEKRANAKRRNAALARSRRMQGCDPSNSSGATAPKPRYSYCGSTDRRLLQLSEYLRRHAVHQCRSNERSKLPVLLPASGAVMDLREL